MRDNAFTPGPWVYRPNEIDDWGRVVGSDSLTVCYANVVRFSSEELNEYRVAGTDPAEPNARLIAAAPDMYDALWETIELSDRTLTEAGHTPECQRVYDIVRAALAKAEGE